MSTELCQLLSDWTGSILPSGALIERKWDGWRALRFPGRSGEVNLWTRNGHAIHGVGHILARLERMEREAGEAMVFDGEFMVDDTLDATKRWCESGWKLGGEAGVLHLFDAVPLIAWRKGIDPTPLHERKARLKALIEATAQPEWEWRAGSRGRDDADAVRFVEAEWAFSASDVVDAARQVWSVGGEGVVVKDADSPYRRGRNADWLKVKAENRHKWRMVA